MCVSVCVHVCVHVCVCVGYTLAACVVMAATCAGVNATYVNEVLNDVAPDSSHATVLALCVLVLELARAAGVLLVQYGVVFFGMWATFYLQVRIELRPDRHASCRPTTQQSISSGDAC